MYRNLNPAALGISGRQSELIELALTYRFGSIDLDMDTIVKRARMNGSAPANRFLASAGIRGGEFSLPVELAAAETTFRSQLVELKEFVDIVADLKPAACRAKIAPVSDTMPYQECFELHRSRIQEVAEALAAKEIRLGLALLAAPEHRADADVPFIHSPETLLTLMRTIDHPNVGLAADTWSWFVGGGTIEELCALPPSSLVSVRLADLPTTVDVAVATEQDRHMPGESGQVDCKALVQHLISSGYDGPLTLCPDSGQFTGMTRDAIVQLARATFEGLCRPSKPEVEQEPTAKSSEPAEASKA